MKLLVLGGTRFVGRAVVESALARGHAVTLHNRGVSAPDLFPQAESLRGDRTQDLRVLEGRAWDAVIDTSGYVPRVVDLSVRALHGRVGHYTFVSTISVYADRSTPGMREDAPRASLPDDATEEITGATYGPFKAACEDVVRDRFGAGALVARPGLIVGPHDPTGRFTYWVERVAGGGDVLAPGDPRAPVQCIDARDLADWLLLATERALGGTYHLTGPATPLTMAGLLLACREATGSDARFHWADEAFLLERGVRPWADLPLWAMTSERGLLSLDLSRALADGLVHRPIGETARDTLTWARGAAAGTHAASAAPLPEGQWPGLTALREKELLEALKALPQVGAGWPGGRP